MLGGQREEGTRASPTGLVFTFFQSWEEQLCVVPTLVFLLFRIFLPLPWPVGEAGTEVTYPF